MIYNKEPQMVWDVHNYEYTNGKISIIKGLPYNTYNPFDSYGKTGTEPIYRLFAAIDENNDIQILDFIRMFGFLGLNTYPRFDSANMHHQIEYAIRDTIQKESFDKLLAEKVALEMYCYHKIRSIVENPQNAPTWANKQTPDYDDMNAACENIDKESMAYLFPEQIKKRQPENLPEYRTIESENISEIKREVTRMKLVLKLWESLSFDEIDMIHTNTIALIRFVNSLGEFIKPNTEPEYPNQIETARYWAGLHIGMQVNRQIHYVRPVIDMSSIRNNISKWNGFEGQWIAYDLLSAMYTMIYMDIVQGKMIRKCKNETCPNWFEIYGNDERKIYCNSKCSNTQGKRMARRLEKQIERDREVRHVLEHKNK